MVPSANGRRPGPQPENAGSIPAGITLRHGKGGPKVGRRVVAPVRAGSSPVLYPLHMAFNLEQKRAHSNKIRGQRRAAAYTLLGGACKICGSTLNLHIDHIDPRTKSKNVSHMWTCSEASFWSEVKKCQLLCELHHKEKTALELQYRTQTIKLKCPHCGTQFEKKPRQLGDHNKRAFCSLSCSGKFYAQQRRGPVS